MYRRLIVLLSWSIPPSIVALICGLAMVQGIEHPWLNTALIISLAITPLMMIYSTSLCITLNEHLSNKIKELDLANLSFSETEVKNRHLQEEIEKLTGMREIQMSSHIESFSDLLRNILKVTHIATDARSLTIFLESHEVLGCAYPKAHMRWEKNDSQVPGEIYVFFEEELLLQSRDEKILDRFNGKAVLQNSMDDENIPTSITLIHDGRPVGQVYDDEIENLGPDQAKQRLDALEKWVGGFEIKVSGAYSCWQNRVLITHNIENSTLISVPILSQGLIIGVLCAEYVGLQNHHAFSQDLRKIHNLLLDYGRNIGQPLKKEELYEQAIKDAMTGLFNKAHYESQLHENFHRTRRYHRDLTFIFLDIDHFKNINDTYGHLTGDIALKSVAKILKDNIRQTDTAFRIGGEELCVLLPESGHEEGLAVAEKLREVIEFTEFPTDQNFTIRFTASFGVASLTEDMTKPEQLVKAADEAVYKAKKTGRNKVISARDLVEN